MGVNLLEEQKFISAALHVINEWAEYQHRKEAHEARKRVLYRNCGGTLTVRHVIVSEIYRSAVHSRQSNGVKDNIRDEKALTEEYI